MSFSADFTVVVPLSFCIALIFATSRDSLAVRTALFTGLALSFYNKLQAIDLSYSSLVPVFEKKAKKKKKNRR